MTDGALCGSCGEHAVRPLACEGRTVTYRGVLCTLPADLVVRTCGACGARWMNGDEVKVYSDILEAQRLASVHRDGVHSQSEGEMDIPVFMGLSSQAPKRILELAVGERVNVGEHTWERVNDHELRMAPIGKLGSPRAVVIERSRKAIVDAVRAYDDAQADAFPTDHD